MSSEEMQINPTRAKELAENLARVIRQVQALRPLSDGITSDRIRVIAVSKLKPANDILALHRSPSSHTDFGENYAQELTEKASLLPRSIRWHMIGALQTNKCKALAQQVPNLYCVSSVDSSKKADQLDKGRATLEGSNSDEKLRVLVQVNTSGEAEKSGVEPQDAAALCRHIRDQCPHLQLGGLMTIGAIARSRATTPGTDNEDFASLRDTRAKVAGELGIDEGELDLSMGMSSDYEAAIKQGSNEIRIGTNIFGTRPEKKDAIIKQDVARETR